MFYSGCDDFVLAYFVCLIEDLSAGKKKHLTQVSAVQNGASGYLIQSKTSSSPTRSASDHMVGDPSPNRTCFSSPFPILDFFARTYTHIQAQDTDACPCRLQYCE